jgi:methylated-DNA-protein-cysteine methyltransferase-like protein
LQLKTFINANQKKFAFLQNKNHFITSLFKRQWKNSLVFLYGVYNNFYMQNKSKKSEINTQTFSQHVYEVVKKIPHGKVATYGDIAGMSGNPHASRAVGWALHRNPNPCVIPCHRVVNRTGRLAPSFAFGGTDAQRNLLQNEGVNVRDDNTVDLKLYGWRG